MNRQSALSLDFSDGGGSAAALQSAVLPSRAMEGALPGPPPPILLAVPSPTAERRCSNVEAVSSQTGHVPRGLELLTTSAGNGARVAPSLASGA